MVLHPFTKPFALFVKEVRKLYGKKHQYIERNHKGARPKMTIVCPEHRKFQQSPEVHLRSSGCKRCATAAEFAKIRIASLKRLKDALREKSGHGVTVDKRSFMAFNKRASFICKMHGTFQKRSYDCLEQLHPCTKCNLRRSLLGYSDKEAFDFLKDRLPEGYRLLPFKYGGNALLLQSIVDSILCTKSSSVRPAAG